MSNGSAPAGAEAGKDANGAGRTLPRPPVNPSDAAALIATPPSAIAGAAQQRVPKADLDERDPDFIRESLPGLWLLASLWFRAEVRGLERIPEEGPVLMVGNHSGGNLTPDTGVFTLAFNTYFGVERRFYQLAHNLVLSMPGLGFLRKYGTVAASPQNADKALDSGAALLVYPGGDYEVHRPIWESAKVDFGGRKGFIRLALEKDVPLVPVVSIGGQETALFLSRGEGLAKLLRLDRMFRLKVLPISIALPWILNVGDMLGHVPAPAKITIQVLQADPPARALRRGPRPRRGLRRRDRPRCRTRSPRCRTSARCRCSARAGMRLEEQITIDAAPEEVWELLADPADIPRFVPAITRFERQDGKSEDDEPGVGARYSMLMHVGSADVGGLIEIVEYDEGRDIAWTSITGIDQRGRWRIREASDGRTRVSLRLSYGSPGGLVGAVTDRLSAPQVRGHLKTGLEHLKAQLEGEPVASEQGKGVVGTLAHEVGSLKILRDAGVIRPIRPDKLVRMAATLIRWGRGPAAGFIAGRAELSRTSRR